MNKVRKFLATFCIILACHAAFGAVAKSDSGTAGVNSAGGVTTLDLTTFTVSAGSNLCLIAALNTLGSITNPTMTWDNGGTPQAMTLGHTVTNSQETRLFYLVAPHTGNLTLHATWTTSRTSSISAVAFSGANQSTCINTSNNASNSSVSTNPTITVTSTTDGATVAADTDNSSHSATTSGQQQYRSGSFALSYTIGNSSNIHSWTASNGTWAAAGVNVIAAAAGGAQCRSGLTLLGVGGC